MNITTINTSILALSLAFSQTLSVAQTTKSLAQEKKEYEKFINEHPFSNRPHRSPEEWKAIPKGDRPDLAAEQEVLKTLDPKLGYVPKERLAAANIYAKQLLFARSAIPNVNWTERGPDNVGGRIEQALMFDPNDATNGYKKVWAGSASGGLWYNNDITSATSAWVHVNAFWDNMSITTMAYDPSNKQIFYVGTGELWADIRGNGILRSTDGGVNWSYMTATQNNSNFHYVNKIVVKANGNVFASTGGGVFKSINQGLSWTAVLTGNGSSDIEIAANGDLFASLGVPWRPMAINSIYKSTNANNGNAGTWVNHVNLGSPQRIDIATAPSDANVLYAIAQGSDNGIVNGGGLFKSSNGGLNWNYITLPIDPDVSVPANDFTRGQAFYDITVKFHQVVPKVSKFECSIKT